MAGPLSGVRIIEIAGLGAAPYGCMMLADMGAEVVRIERLGGDSSLPPGSPLLRNRRTIQLDLKRASGREIVLSLVKKADGLVEAFRPGVAERLGIGPDACRLRNPRLVYARLTGWGQTGPLAQAAGHDLNFIALTGLLRQLGPSDGKPIVPLNVIGDFGAGGLLLAFGLVCALLEARQSGRGQVVDTAMVDGVFSFMAMYFGDRAAGRFIETTGSNLLGGGAHYYNVYETSDAQYLAVAPIEPQFYRAFLDRLGLNEEQWVAAGYPAEDADTTLRRWPALKSELARLFRTRTRDEWCALFEGSDVCVTPVLTLGEAVAHPHNLSRGALTTVDGVQQGAPAPRFSRTAPGDPKPRQTGAAQACEVMKEWDIENDLLRRAVAEGALPHQDLLT